MKNIHTILSEIGITIPEDKKAEFDKAVAENYKTSAEHEKKVTRLTNKNRVIMAPMWAKHDSLGHPDN